jgi:hypothetical protein
MAELSTFNRTTMSGAAVGLDIYDTLDDFNNAGPFLTQSPVGWPGVNPSNWLRDPTTDNGAGAGVAGDGLCNGTEDCIFKDRLTGSY